MTRLQPTSTLKDAILDRVGSRTEEEIKCA